jgi:hypothetical protein
MIQKIGLSIILILLMLSAVHSFTVNPDDFRVGSRICVTEGKLKLDKLKMILVLKEDCSFDYTVTYLGTIIKSSNQESNNSSLSLLTFHPYMNSLELQDEEVFFGDNQTKIDYWPYTKFNNSFEQCNNKFTWGPDGYGIMCKKIEDNELLKITIKGRIKSDNLECPEKYYFLKLFKTDIPIIVYNNISLLIPENAGEEYTFELYQLSVPEVNLGSQIGDSICGQANAYGPNEVGEKGYQISCRINSTRAKEVVLGSGGFINTRQNALDRYWIFLVLSIISSFALIGLSVYLHSRKEASKDREQINSVKNAVIVAILALILFNGFVYLGEIQYFSGSVGLVFIPPIIAFIGILLSTYIGHKPKKRTSQ